MKVDRKQLSIYSGLVFFIILTVITAVLEQSMADKVFSSYDSQIIHEKECKELDLSKDLVEFPSAQQAVASGALPCKFCMGQYASNSGNQQALIGDTIFNSQTMNSEDTQTMTDAVNQPYIHQEEPRHKKTQKRISGAIRIINYFSVEQLIGLCGNIENKSADFKVRLPKGFKETLMKLEAQYNDEWAAFDQHTDGCIVYYGWVRGNVLGEYKLRLCEDYQTDLISIDFISLTRHGVGGMAISRFKDAQKTDKKAFSSYDWFSLPLKVRDILVGPLFVNTDKKLSYDGFKIPLKGRDKWGPFSVQVVGEIIGTGEMMVGSWDTDHGSFGNYKGTLYGIRLDSVKTASASITDQNLYQTMINFNP
jgi:hypothetical protein